MTVYRYLLCSLVAAAALAWVPQATAHQGTIAEEALLESENLEETEGNTSDPDSDDSDSDDCGCPSPADATSQFERTQACFCVHVLCNALIIDELRTIWERSDDPNVHELLLTGFTMNGVPVGSTEFWLAMHEADQCAGGFVGTDDPTGNPDGDGSGGGGEAQDSIPLDQKDITEMTDSEWEFLDDVFWDYLENQMMDPALGLPVDAYTDDFYRYLLSTGYSGDVIALMADILEQIVICLRDDNCDDPLPSPPGN